MKYRKISFFLLSFLVLYNFIFPVRLSFLPFSSYLPLIPVVLFFFVRVLRSEMVVQIPLRTSYIMKYFCIVFSALYFLAFLSVVISKSDDFYIFTILTLYFSTFFISFVLAYEISRLEARIGFNQTIFFDVIALIAFFISLSVLLEVFFPAMKGLFNALIAKSSNINFDTGYRASGMASSGGAAQSFGMAICFAFILLAVRTVKRSFWVICFYSLSLMVTFSAVFFVGRSGFMLCLLFFLLFFVEILIVSKPKVKILVVGSCFLFVSLATALLQNLDPKAFKFFMGYSLELFNNMIESGEFESKSTSHLQTMYFVPNWVHFLFGGGFYSSPLHGYPLPDPGVMKVLLAFGVFGFINFYLFSFVLLKNMCSEVVCCLNKKSILPYFIALSFVLYEFKEPGLYQNYAFRVMLFCLFYFQLYNYWGFKYCFKENFFLKNKCSD